MSSTVTQTLITVLILTTTIATSSAYAARSEGLDELRIHTGAAKKNGDSIVSISARWLMSDGLISGTTGLVFIKGPDMPKGDNAVSMARRISNGLKRGMALKRPSLRAIKVSLIKDPEDPQFIMQNKQGILITQITIRDFTNQKFTAEIGASSFASAGVKVAIDLVESAAVAEVQMNFSAGKKNFKAEGGEVVISIGNDKPVKVETANKTIEAIEKALATKIGASFSSSPISPHAHDKRDKKNIKPFDGGEIQFGSITAKTITIDVNDPSLGLITKYKFRDEE